MQNRVASVDDASKKCFLHYYLEDHHHAKWHSRAASESEECALCQHLITPPLLFLPGGGHLRVA